MHIECPGCRYRIEVTDTQAQGIVCPSCGSSVHLDGELTPTVVATSGRIGKFELLMQVGAGGYGAVWKARDTELGRVVAVKIPHHGRLDTARDMERFLREARSSAQLRHPGIVSVHEVGFHG